MMKASAREPSPIEPMGRARSGSSQDAPHPGSEIRQHALIVLGPHRSGTSALTRVLSLCGAELPARILRAEDGLPNDGNTQAGFWESRPLLDLHTEVLESSGSRWDDPYDIPSPWFDSDSAKALAERLAEILGEEFGAAPLFVAKDPRISRIVPIWDRALEKLGAQARWLIAVRNPLEVAASLGARDHFSQTKGLLIWLSYFLAAERYTRRYDRLFVLYDDVLQDWRRVVATIADQFGITFPRCSPRSAAEIDGYLDPRLRHHATPPEALDGADESVLDWVNTAFRWAMAAAAGKPAPGEQLDGLYQILHQTESVYAPLLATAELDAAKLAQDLDVLRQEKADAESQAIRELGLIRGQLADREETLAKITMELAELQHLVEQQQIDQKASLLAHEQRLARAREELENRLANREETLATIATELADLQRLDAQQQTDDPTSSLDREQSLTRAREELESRLADREERLITIAAELADLQRLVERQQDDHRDSLLGHEQSLSRAREELAELRCLFEQHGPDRNPRVKTLAFYLPQYHPIPENDRWWGKGFTEWANVSSAKPCFDGHEQPMLPSDLGFYDLRIPSVRAQQAALAREHGIHGFCYYHYWFHGKKLLEHPLEEVIASGEPDFPFCICWANENWTRRWDGEDDHILLAQNHSPESDARFIADVLPALLDPRYIRKDGKPLLLVYRADLLADPLATTAIWRKAAREAGLPGLHLCAVWRVKDPLAIGFDALVEFPPHHVLNRGISNQIPGLADDYSGRILDYAAAVDAVRPLEDNDFPIYRGAMPAWDNTPRLGKRASIFFGSTPELYGKWLEMLLSESASRPGDDDQFVFINAWNEWAEGATLEPSRRYGREYLEATRSAVRKATESERLAEIRTDLKRLEGRIDDRFAASEKSNHALVAEHQSVLRSLRQAYESVEARLAEDRSALEGLRNDLSSRLTGHRAALEHLTANAEWQGGERVALASQLRNLAHRTGELQRLALAREVGRAPHGLWLNRYYGALALALKLPIWLLSGRFRSRLSWWRQARRILRTGLFDQRYYLERHPDVAALSTDPLYHYVRCGAAEGRDPNAHFDTRQYLVRYPEAAASGNNPLLHYLSHGLWESPFTGKHVTGKHVTGKHGIDHHGIEMGYAERTGPPTALMEPGQQPSVEPAESSAVWRINSRHARSRSADSRPILVIGHDAARAGAQLILLEIVKSLKELADLEIFVILLDGGDLEKDYRRHVHTFELSQLTAAGLSLEHSLQRALSELKEQQPLLALCNTVASSDAAKICRYHLGLPVLSMVYELPTSIESAIGLNRLIDVVESSKRVVVASQFVEDALKERYNIASPHLTPLHTGVLPWAQRATSREACRARVLAELELPEDTFLVLGCGTIHHRKGNDLFVQVAREASTMHAESRMFFLWIGADQTGPLFRQWCEHDVRSAGIEGRIRFAGVRDSTSDYFAAADAFALTSREDPFPMVSLEAMAWGVPVVAFQNAGGACEALTENAGLLVPYLDVKEMARSLIRLCEAPRFHAEISRNAREKIARDFQWCDYIAKLVAIFEEDFGYRSLPVETPSDAG